jgi:hypothetical protein
METPASTETKAPPARSAGQRLRFFGTRHGRLLINLGCVPLVLVLTLSLIGFVSFVTFFRVPQGIVDKASYVAGGRLIIGVIASIGLQTLATWALGLIAALFGLRAAAGQGALVKRRLEVLWRRTVVGAWAIVALRMVFIVVVIFGAIQIYTTLFGFQLSWDVADELFLFLRRYPIVLVIAFGIVLVQWLVGPLLRLRLSLALGLLAGTWAEDRDQRPWLALTLRLGTELGGLVLLMWSFTLTRILLGVIFDPLGTGALGQYPDLFPALPPRAAGLATLLVSVALVLVVHTVLQVGLTQLAVNSAQRRLSNPKPATFYTKTGTFFKELARASVSKGEAT